jgi:hypothetical protein
MATFLKHDMAGISDFSLLNSEVEELEEKVTDVPVQPTRHILTRYLCIYTRFSSMTSEVAAHCFSVESHWAVHACRRNTERGMALHSIPVPLADLGLPQEMIVCTHGMICVVIKIKG